MTSSSPLVSSLPSRAAPWRTLALAATLSCVLGAGAPALAAPTPAPTGLDEARQLVATFQADDAAGAQDAAAALTKLDPAVAGAAVVAAYDDAADDTARLRLLDALHLVGGEAALPDLHRWLLANPSPRVAERVAQILSQAGDDRSAAVLAAASLKHPDAQTRSVLIAARRLVRKRHPGARRATATAVAPATITVDEPFRVTFVAAATETAGNVGAGLLLPKGVELLSKPPHGRHELTPEGRLYEFEFVLHAAPERPVLLKLTGAWSKRDTFVVKAGVRFEPDPQQSGQLRVVVPGTEDQR